MYHSKEDALKAEQEFDNIFINKGIPENIPEFKSDVAKMTIIDLIVTVNFAPSKGEARRLIQQGGVSIIPSNQNSDGEKITDIFHEITFKEESVLKVGKRNFIKLLKIEE
jgi:tyrosyl-tRNA synthetase